MSGDEGLIAWISNIDRYGIGFVDNVPISKEKTTELARRISHFRETHYGSFWDFSADLEHGDTAYSTIALPAHTDTTYFTDPIGLQFFHLMKHRGTGGKSLYVDGLSIAEKLKFKEPWAFEALTQIHISAHSTGDSDTNLRPTPAHFPIIRLDDSTGEVCQIKFNNDDRSTLSLTTLQTEQFYAALREWSNLVRAEENELWIQLKPGRAVIMDNWRVLHGRSSFTGYRRMIGCYFGWDDYQSRLKTLKKSLS